MNKYFIRLALFLFSAIVFFTGTVNANQSCRISWQTDEKSCDRMNVYEAMGDDLCSVLLMGCYQHIYPCNDFFEPEGFADTAEIAGMQQATYEAFGSRAAGSGSPKHTT